MLSIQGATFAVMAFVLLQGCVQAQRRSQYSDPFGGVYYYSGSRVALAPRRSPANKTQSSYAVGYGQSLPSYVRPTPSVTTTTTTTTTTRPTTTTTRPTTTRYWTPRASKYLAAASTSPPESLRIEPYKTKKDRLVYMPAHYVESESVAARRRKFKEKYGHLLTQHESEYKGTSEYRDIKNGSYYDGTSATAPPKSEVPVFKWEQPQHKHRHHHRHYHTTTTTRPHHHRPTAYWSQAVDRYAEFEARTETHRPPTRATPPPQRLTLRRHTTTAPYSHHGGSTARYQRRPDTYTTLSSTRVTDGSYWYHQKQKALPKPMVRKVSDRVSYVSGSYFPASNGARKP